MRVRYRRWSGTQEPFGTTVSADTVLDEVSDDLLAGVPADEAVRRLLRRGLEGRVAGLDELRRRVEEARRRELARFGLEEPLRRVQQRLAAIVDAERAALELGDPEVARRHHADLDALPEDVAGRLSALDAYDWVDERAAADFRQLRDELRQDVAAATFGRLAEALGQMSGDDVAHLRDFLADLNAAVGRQQRGEDPGFADLRARYRDLVGDAGGLDELLAQMARRMAAASRLLAGLDDEQRAQLAALAEQVLGEAGLAFEVEQLRRALRDRFPELAWDRPPAGAQPAGGPGDASLSQAVDWMATVTEHEELAAALGQDYPGARLDDVDPEAVRRLLGEEAARDLAALRDIERALEEAGAASRHGGTLDLTSRGIRRLGETALARIYERAVTGGIGSHQARGAGGDGELTGATRPLRFGDPFRLDVARTLGNAVQRAGPRTGRTLRLEAGDFELAEAERRVRAVTVLLLDMSFSMPLRGNWVPAKRVALALSALVATRFPEDRLYVVGFSDYARRLQPADLLASGWERVYGTNMQHAFLLARRLLGAHPGAEQQVIMVTDGEPTAHLEGDVPVFAWPPEPRTLHLTMVEAARLARVGATLNVFLLDHDPGAAAFVERMVRTLRGRIFYPDLEDLGHLVVRDFLANRVR